MSSWPGLLALASEPGCAALLLLELLELDELEDEDGNDGMGLGLPLLEDGDGKDGEDCELLDDDGVDGMLLLGEELDDEGMDGMPLLLDWLAGDWHATRPNPRPVARMSLQIV